MPHDVLLSRIRAEYEDLPGLRLTPLQAQRLCGVEGTLCRKLFDALIAEKFLHVTPDGAFARLPEGAMPPLTGVTADPGTERQAATAP